MCEKRRIERLWVAGLAFALSFSACSEEFPAAGGGTERGDGVPVVFAPVRATRANGDTDNTAGEYAIDNISVFLAVAGSSTIDYGYVHQSFSSLDNGSIENPKMVSLPLTPGSLADMDVYVIANCYDVAGLGAVRTVDDIRALQTARAPVTTGPLPMYGELSDADLNTSTTTSPLTVPLTRTVAKLRITVTFADPDWVGADNRFVVEQAAPYTYYAPGNISAFDASEFVDYPAIALNADATPGQFTGVAYVYESASAPRLHIYTTVGGTAKEYIALDHFPVPVRNYLYDIEIRLLKPSSATGSIQ